MTRKNVLSKYISILIIAHWFQVDQYIISYSLFLILIMNVLVGTYI